ncbi:ATP-binding cassette domain-containing protein [candidate division KSB1 bacterium]|nr:ATP-binding cassette domain-containing protein [candidate division KSB1 bacterium]
MFKLKNVSIKYEDTKALHNISLEINEGEKVALIGPSGAGKTTLLRTLYELKRENAAFIHQDYALVPQLSVFNNVYAGRLDRYTTAYNLLNLIKPQKNELEQINLVLKRLQLEEKKFNKVGALSGGQQQRVAVARALFRGGDVLLGDEPVSSIDPHQAGTIVGILTEATKTVVLSLHSVELALQYFSRIIGLRLGKVLFDLPRKDINDSLLEKLFHPC